MQRVYLLRHGEAADLAPGGRRDDDARELSGPGRELLVRACAAYARILGPHTPQIWHSPLLRARQTAEILGAAIAAHRGTEPPGALDGPGREVAALVPDGPPARVVGLLQAGLFAGAGAIVLVGHQPLLGDLVGQLITGNERAGFPLETGMLVGLELHDPHGMLGRLRVLLDQGTAARLGDGADRR